MRPYCKWRKICLGYNKDELDFNRFGGSGVGATTFEEQRSVAWGGLAWWKQVQTTPGEREEDLWALQHCEESSETKQP